MCIRDSLGAVTVVRSPLAVMVLLLTVRSRCFQPSATSRGSLRSSMPGWWAEQSSRPVDEDHLGCLFDVVSWVFAFDELAVFEAGPGSDEGDQVWCVHGAPPALGGFDELERHRDAGGFGPGALGDLGAVADGGEGRLDRVRGPQVDPVLGGVVVEREQLLDVIGDP